MKKVLTPAFFNRPTVKVAEGLLGKFLVRRRRGKTKAYMITEVEAYDGLRDKASHAYRGRTARNAVMFGPAGYWYVYFTYGMHWMLNAVTGPKDYPAAVLIRGIESANGPARLTKRLGVDGRMSGKPISRKSGLWIEDKGVKIDEKSVRRTGRIGVAYAGKYWARRRYRFYVELHCGCYSEILL